MIKSLNLEAVPEYEILDESPLRAVHGSAQRLLTRICEVEANNDTWNLRESVWPALGAHGISEPTETEIRPRLVLLPLSRIGAEGGFSGSKILLGYFSDQGPRKIFPSLPMVIKLAEQKNGMSKLVEERELAQAVRPYLAYHKDFFAIPLYLDRQHPEFHVLWSPFALTELVEWAAETSRLSLSARDLRQLLGGQKTASTEAEELVKAVFKILEPLHRRARPAVRVTQSWSSEYEKYLRGFRQKWGEEWLNAWGEDKFTADFGSEGWYNPIWVVDQLFQVPDVTLLCGAVHGDLHPGNILYSQVGSPSVIDFGWANADAHVAKDFVLLECNLRFIYLRGDVSFADVQVFSKWLAMNTTCGSLTDPACVQAHSTIQTIRSCFRALAGEAADWDIEYIVPLFLVGFGLLRFINQYWNQIAARLAILELARYIAETVLPKLTPASESR